MTEELSLKRTEGSAEPLGKSELSVMEFKDIHSNKVTITQDKMLHLNRKDRQLLLKDIARTLLWNERNLLLQPLRTGD